MLESGSFSSFAAWRQDRRERGAVRPVAFVPTMGALHQGHASLIRRAKLTEGPDLEVVVSVYVNPTQFNDSHDFDAYPSSHERDLEVALEAGADAVVFPRADELYPEGVPQRADRVNFGELTSLWEGAHRPGHFDGVVAVVRSLFHQVQPKWALFGEKDWQQLAVIQRLAELEFPKLNVVPVATMREENGLAMSSRNARLSHKDRSQAGKLHSTMLSVVRSTEVLNAVAAAKLKLEKCGFELEYLALVDGISMQPSLRPKASNRLIVAANFGGVRLIDNVSLGDS
jgi:pantoate--beta-alanine ligase